MNSEYGVFVVVNDIGLLIQGPAGIGKSTLALELIERGHALVADDIVHFSTDTAQNRLIGQSPDMLRGLLAVRDLGVLEIQRLFPAARLAPSHPLDLIVELDDSETSPLTDPFSAFKRRDLHGFAVSGLTLFAHPKRNLAVIVETAVKNYILYRAGHDAGRVLTKRQQQYL